MTRKAAEPQFVETEITVRYAETDQMGIVYYANYLVWFEAGRNAWCQARGFRYSEMESLGKRYLIVAEASCRYKTAARFEDVLIVRTGLSRATDRIIEYSYQICNKRTGELLATGQTKHVVTDTNTRPSRLPDQYRRYFGLPGKGITNYE